MKSKYTLLGLFILAGYAAMSGTLFGQEAVRPDPAYQLGLHYERSGDYENALKIFRELYRNNPGDEKYLVRIEQNLRNLKHYDELSALLEAERQKHPDDVNVLGKLADVYLKWGKLDDARRYFDEILKQGNGNTFLYTFISNLLIQNRMFEEAIALLEDARKKLNDDNLFHYDLARLYGWHSNFKASADEYLKIAQNDPKNFPIIEREFMNFPDDSSAVRQILLAFSEIAVMDPDNTQLLQLKANYFLRHRMYGDAFRNFIKLDTLYHAEGKQVLDFAQQAFRNGDYEAAAKAYRYVIDTYPGREHTSDAEFGLAFSFERQGVLPEGTTTAKKLEISSEQGASLAMAVERYREIIRANPGSEWAQNAYFRMGEVQFERLYNIDEAIQAFASAAAANPENPAGRNALKRLADCYVAKGDLEKAYATYEQVALACRESAPDLAWDAEFNKAEIDYYRGDFKAARVRIDTLLTLATPDKAIYNDILTRSGFLSEHSTADSVSLIFYARGEFYARQRNRMEAIAVYEDILKRFSDSPLSDDCHYQSALLAAELGNPGKALEHLGEILLNHGDSYYADRAQKKMGEIYAFVLNDPEKAVKTFEEFLTAYPNSIFIDDVRAEIRSLER